MVDGRGLPLRIVLTPGQASDKAAVAGEAGEDVPEDNPAMLVYEMRVVDAYVHEMPDHKAHENNEQPSVNDVLDGDAQLLGSGPGELDSDNEAQRNQQGP